MSDCEIFRPTSDPRVFVAPDGTRRSPPPDWACLPPGDAMLTRRVKAAGPSWAVVEKRGRKTFSKGLWAPRTTIERLRAEVLAERSTRSYADKLRAGQERRERVQADYVVGFEREVLGVLAFAPRWHELARAVARRVATHATPVGSGTVARAQRLTVRERAHAALNAWLRHQTTDYDRMHIPRIRGRRRQVRRELAEISQAVIQLHRRDEPHRVDACPLCSAFAPAHGDAADHGGRATMTRS